MPSSPRTPGHSRNSSAVQSHPGSPLARRQSRSSIPDSATPFRNSLHHHHDALEPNDLSGGGVTGGASNGMGNLADELADAFSDYSEGEEGDEAELYDDKTPSAEDQPTGTQPAVGGAEAAADKPHSLSPKGDTLNLPSHQRVQSKKGNDYDGSEYGSESDLESPGMLPSLVTRIDAVESLARRGTENYGGPADDVFKRVTDSLRDLGSQSSVEGSASRFVLASLQLTLGIGN
jgi:hypothetical protein